jgi:predicted PurR-regulated permease PerM
VTGVVSTRSFQQAVAWGMALLIAYFIYRISRAFLAPLTWASILVIFFFPLHRRISARIGRANLAALFSVTAVTILLVGPAAWLIPAFVSEAVGTLRAVPSEAFLVRAREWVEPALERFPLRIGTFEEILDRVNQYLSSHLAEASAQVAGNVAQFLFSLFVMILAMFYLFRDGPAVVRFLKDLAPLGGEYRDRMVREVSELISVTVSSGLAVAGVQGLVGGLLFWMLEVPAPVFWGAIMALLAFLPVIGPWLIWAPAGVGMIMAGGTGRGVTLLVLGFLVVSGADNILRPIMIADRSQLNGLLVFISVLGGISAFGLLGVVLGPLVVATAVGLLRGYRDSLLAAEAPGGPRGPT